MNTLFSTLSIGLIILLAISVGCKSSKSTDGNDAASMAPLFQLKSGPCYGRCPIYHLSVSDKGLATVEKKRYMNTLGKYQLQLEESTILNIVRTLDDIEFMSLPDEYESTIPDLPMTTMIYRKNGVVKTVKARENLPQDLRNLQNDLELLLKDGDWTLIEAYEDTEATAEKDIILSEILVQANTGVSLNRWQKRYADYGLRLLTRIDKEQNIWLYTWDQSTISPQEMIAYLRNDADIKSAHYNYKTVVDK